MNKNEKFVITINRELGSGGRTVGRRRWLQQVARVYIDLMRGTPVSANLPTSQCHSQQRTQGAPPCVFNFIVIVVILLARTSAGPSLP